MKRFTRAAVASLCCILVPAHTPAADRQFNKELPASPGGLLVVETDVGSVRVTGSTGNTVTVRVDMNGSEKELGNLEISASEFSGGVKVTGEMKRKGFWESWNADVKFVIGVPKEYNVRLTTSGGDVEVATLKGKVDASTSGGDVAARDVEGPTRLKTSGGDIRAREIRGDLYANTSGGSVEVIRVGGAVEAETSGGDVEVREVTGKVRAETSGGNVRIVLKGTNKGIQAETSGGNIEIVVDGNIAANIDASTVGGDVECDLPLTVSGKISEDHIKGTINGGGETIVARTSGGNVRIRSVK